MHGGLALTRARCFLPAELPHSLPEGRNSRRNMFRDTGLERTDGPALFAAPKVVFGGNDISQNPYPDLDLANARLCGLRKA